LDFSRQRLDTLVYDMALSDLKSFLPAERLAHLDPRTDPFPTMLIDYTITHPGAQIYKIKRADLHRPEVVGDLEVAKKDKKYRAQADAQKYVLLPFHINAYGRVHPLAWSFLNFIATRASAKALVSARSETFGDDNPDRRLLFRKRAFLRKVSITVQRHFALGTLHAAKTVVPLAHALGVNTHPHPFIPPSNSIIDLAVSLTGGPSPAVSPPV
jgi:hypothetical protein